MANNTLSSLSPTLLKVLEIAKPGVPVSPSQINDHVGKGNYAAKHVLYLKILGYDFSVAKSGRNVVSYTLIKEPANAAALVAAAQSKGSGTKAKTAKTKAAPAAKTKTATKKVVAPVVAKTKPTKSVAEIKAANLAKLKEVGAAHKKLAKRVREFDDVTETFGTTGEVGTSFNVDGDWDSVEGLDLKNLL
jgi:hypothetical protein